MALSDSLASPAPERRKNPFEHPGRLRLRTLILIRWISILGQITAVIVVTYGLGYDVPLISVGLVIGASVLVNVVVTAQRRRRVHLSNRDAAFYLAYDVLQLAVLLYLTGGLENPFAILLLAPPTVGATILDRRSTAWLIGLTVAVATLLALWHMPIPPLTGGRQPEPRIETFGLWMSLSLSAVVVSAYIWRVAAEARGVAEALSRTQMALAREQRVSSLGALAAATAHELGTPLGTIALVAGELAEDLPEDSPIAGDIAVLVEQTRRCRGILENLSRRPDEAPRGAPDEVMDVTALLDSIAATYSRPGVDVVLERPSSAGDGQPPTVERTPELTHALANLIHNAVRFARSQVAMRVAWDGDRVSVTIADDGPGFPPGLLGKLGEPYLAQRSRESGGQSNLGLGIFIAKTLLDRQGATLDFTNARNGGAQVVISWRRAMSQG